jgi:diacylglycerol kinase family enzyme
VLAADGACLSAVRAPRFGLLALGTGNAIASWVNASPARRGGVLDDLLRARSGEIPSVRELDLIEAEGRRAPFAGLGLDAQILNDYDDMRRKLAHSSWDNFLRGGAGYTWALASRTAPRMLRRQPPVEVEVVNTGSPAHRLDHEGNRVGDLIDPGQLLYRGPCKIVAAGTVPHLGFKVKFFPFAGRRRGMMHLRIADPPPLHSLLAHMPSIWRGTYFPPGTHDFFCDRVKIRFSRPLPYQVGGDAEGSRDEVSFGMAKRSVELVSFDSEPRYLH